MVTNTAGGGDGGNGGGAGGPITFGAENGLFCRDGGGGAGGCGPGVVMEIVIGWER